MSKQPVRDSGFVKRSGKVLIGIAERGGKIFVVIAESLFLLAFFLFCFKLFWSLVREFTFFALDIVLAWPMLLRLIVGIPLIAAPVLLAGYLLFGDEERPGWLVLTELRKHPVVKSWFGLFRSGAAVVGSFAFLKLIWLTGEEGADAIDWWHMFGELLHRF